MSSGQQETVVLSMKVDPRSLRYDELVVDRKHIEVLKRQITEDGGILVPPQVWDRDSRIIDGFHRTNVAVELEIPEIEILLISCSEERFWDRRISQAKSHQNVSDERLVQWMQDAWVGSEFYRNSGALLEDQLLQVDGWIRKGQVGYLPESSKRLAAWFEGKARLWDQSLELISDSIFIKMGIVNKEVPEAKPLVVDLGGRARDVTNVSRGLYELRKATGTATSVDTMKKYAETSVIVGEYIPPVPWNEARKRQEEEESAAKAAAKLKRSTNKSSSQRNEILGRIGELKPATRIVDYLSGSSIVSVLRENTKAAATVESFLAAASKLSSKVGSATVNPASVDKRIVELNAEIADLRRQIAELKSAPKAVQVPPDVMAVSSSELRY